MSCQRREFYEILCMSYLFHKREECMDSTCFPQAPAKRLFQYSIETILHYLYLEIGILQTSRSIGRKSCQSCLRCCLASVWGDSTCKAHGDTSYSVVSYLGQTSVAAIFSFSIIQQIQHCLPLLEENNLLRLCTKVWKSKTNAIYNVNTNLFHVRF